MRVVKNEINNINDCIKVLNNIVRRCEECKFATCEQCEISWTEVQSIKIILGNLDALCDMQRSADRELERCKKIIEEKERENKELKNNIKDFNLDLTSAYINGVEDGKAVYKIKIKRKMDELQELIDFEQNNRVLISLCKQKEILKKIL